MAPSSSVVLLCSILLAGTASADYTLSKDYTGSAFFDGFSFNAIPDPTHGCVDYVDEETANSTGLAGILNINHQNTGTVRLGVDNTTHLSAGEPRKSTRVISNEAFGLGSLIVADIGHHPGGICGTWPAFWLLGQGTWPQGGEIDIMEGINDQSTNAITLHTGSGFAIQNNPGSSLAKLVTSDCDVNAADQSTNKGCQMAGGAYGTDFNSQGGGVFAIELQTDYIKIWFFGRADIPDALSVDRRANGISSADLKSKLGTPMAWFQPSDGSSIANHFKPQQILFNTDLCGDWAGKAWDLSASCPHQQMSCEAYVAQTPDAFDMAYWDINSLRVYTEGDVVPASQSVKAASNPSPISTKIKATPSPPTPSAVISSAAPKGPGAVIAGVDGQPAFIADAEAPPTSSAPAPPSTVPTTFATVTSAPPDTPYALRAGPSPGVPAVIASADSKVQGPPSSTAQAAAASSAAASPPAVSAKYDDGMYHWKPMRTFNDGMYVTTWRA